MAESECCEHEEFWHEDTSEHVCLVCLGLVSEGQLTQEAVDRLTGMGGAAASREGPAPSSARDGGSA